MTTKPIDSEREAFPAMRTALRTTESCGPDKLYEMVFRFKSLSDLHAADAEWRAALAQAPKPVPQGEREALIAKLRATKIQGRTAVYLDGLMDESADMLAADAQSASMRNALALLQRAEKAEGELEALRAAFARRTVERDMAINGWCCTQQVAVPQAPTESDDLTLMYLDGYARGKEVRARELSEDEVSAVCSRMGPTPAGKSWAKHVADSFLLAARQARPDPATDWSAA